MTLKKRRSLRNQRGFTLIDILFVVGLIGVLCSMAIPGLTRARGAAQASSALGTLRVINSAQLSFAITCGLGFYSPDLQTLGVRPPSATDAFLSPLAHAIRASSVCKAIFSTLLAELRPKGVSPETFSIAAANFCCSA